MEFRHITKIHKADFGRDGKTRIIIKASSEVQDREGDTILQESYRDKSMQAEFIRDGFFDWQHMTDYYEAVMKSAKPSEVNSLMIEREKAIIGRPTEIGFKDDFPSEYCLESGKLYTRGYLLNENQYVAEVLSKLRAGYDAYAASVMGEAVRVHKAAGAMINKVRLKKIALAQRSDVMNPDTSVSLLKAKKLHTLNQILKGGLLQKSGFGKIEPMEHELEEQSLIQQIEELTARLARLEGMTGMHHSYIMEQPDFYNGMAADLGSQVESQAVPIGYEAVKDMLMEKYYCPEDVAKSLAENYVIELKIRNKNEGAY